jgi:hypothetical protein
VKPQLCGCSLNAGGTTGHDHQLSCALTAGSDTTNPKHAFKLHNVIWSAAIPAGCLFGSSGGMLKKACVP